MAEKTPPFPPDRGELFFGLVGAIGSDLDMVTKALDHSLADVGYQCTIIRLIELLHDINRWAFLPENPLEVRIHTHMDAGNEVRDKLRRGDALIGLAIGWLRENVREPENGDADKPIGSRAYIFRSLKHPDEVRALRKVYGPRFFLIAAYSPHETRVGNLAFRIAESHGDLHSAQFRDEAEKLIARDEDEDKAFGQKVRATFHQADVFIRASDRSETQESLNRFIHLIFGHPFYTPTRDEFGMFHARAAALRSASLGRQVGAVIASAEGDVIAVGSNEVPKAGGGLYWEGDVPDRRDHQVGYDSNDRMKRSVLANVVERLSKSGWLVSERATALGTDFEKVIDEAAEVLKGSLIASLIEFGRSVHAEMAALIDAARRGVTVKGGTLYTTTFPCHECARHIVAAGIPRVVYIEPYPKSLVPELYLDSIAVDSPKDCEGQVNFNPFVGIDPRQYLQLFNMMERKGHRGQVVEWVAGRSKPRPEFVGARPYYFMDERDELNGLQEEMVRCGLVPADEDDQGLSGTRKEEANV